MSIFELVYNWVYIPFLLLFVPILSTSRTQIKNIANIVHYLIFIAINVVVLGISIIDGISLGLAFVEGGDFKLYFDLTIFFIWSLVWLIFLYEKVNKNTSVYKFLELYANNDSEAIANLATIGIINLTISSLLILIFILYSPLKLILCIASSLKLFGSYLALYIWTRLKKSENKYIKNFIIISRKIIITGMILFMCITITSTVWHSVDSYRIHQLILNWYKNGAQI